MLAVREIAAAADARVAALEAALKRIEQDAAEQQAAARKIAAAADAQVAELERALERALALSTQVPEVTPKPAPEITPKQHQTPKLHLKTPMTSSTASTNEGFKKVLKPTQHSQKAPMTSSTASTNEGFKKVGGKPTVVPETTGHVVKGPQPSTPGQVLVDLSSAFSSDMNSLTGPPSKKPMPPDILDLTMMGHWGTVSDILDPPGSSAAPTLFPELGLPDAKEDLTTKVVNDSKAKAEVALKPIGGHTPEELKAMIAKAKQDAQGAHADLDLVNKSLSVSEADTVPKAPPAPTPPGAAP